MPLDITASHQGDRACVFRLEGRLDAQEAPIAYDSMVQELGAQNRAVLDLAGVSYISSGGISILIRLAHHLREDGGELHLAAPQPFVRKVFDIVSFDQILRIFEDVDQAVQEFGAA